MTEKLTTFDPAADLASDEAIAVFMAEAFQTNDAAYVAHALGVVARAKGMAQIAGQTGLSREQLYRSFSESSNPTLKTTLAVMKALGIELTARVPVVAWINNASVNAGTTQVIYDTACRANQRIRLQKRPVIADREAWRWHYSLLSCNFASEALAAEARSGVLQCKT